jgi:hypothetical protein
MDAHKFNGKGKICQSVLHEGIRGGGTKVQIHSFINSAKNWAKWPASRPGRINPRKYAPYTFNRRVASEPVCFSYVGGGMWISRS